MVSDAGGAEIRGGRRQSGDMGKGAAGEVQRVMDRRRSRAVSVRARESGPSGWNGEEDGAYWKDRLGSGGWCDRGMKRGVGGGQSGERVENGDGTMG